MTEESDRRWHNRRGATLGARVMLNDATLPCTVRNMSASGAQLTFATSVELPQEFALEVPQLDLKVHAQLIWSRAEQHGVTFLWPQYNARG